MVHQITSFTDSVDAWKQWSLVDFTFRSECLLSLCEQVHHIPEFESALLTDVIRYHIQHSARLVENPHELLGPTGESNQLYCMGRGVSLLIFDDSAHESVDRTQKYSAYQAFIALLSTSILAGNAVVICCNNEDLNRTLASALHVASFPINLIQIRPLEDSFSFAQEDIASVGYIGNSVVEQRLNIHLAQRKGAIINLVSETCWDRPLICYDPNLALHFMTERTCTINTTAVGGNTTLLELGAAED
ncbi:hypothetical protein BCU68_03745 [Vibrio sp. 10N.286.49.B3]|uniref:1-pyrroline-5-carboxylate dehydrogenase n=1 Tax=Vibrio sp. 10N.286.49.B3 TaxID=1880855 RepID=UPI000C81674A|nr:1-pyrroline-5-carboxylate dehydrogenase [Vibrio sp. 10N.286.49.B3]PMH43114.1 hypothetical protein BCU68_03745 [Vibrio sp. 10N.286.49.B3]